MIYSNKKAMCDSGAHTIYNELMKNHKGGKLDGSRYKSQQFWDYVDSYAKFIKRWDHLFDCYVTVDAIRNPKISWKVTKYLENEHGLSPMPVIHFGTDVKWVHKYLDAGYKYIGLGGKVRRQPYFSWGDRVWKIICDTPNRTPLIKVHGFAVTSVQIAIRYPWYSVDSTGWKKNAYYGQVLIPPKINGEFSFCKPYRNIFIDETSPYTKRTKGYAGRHFKHLPPTEQSYIKEWFKQIKVPFGKIKNGEVVVEGVSNSIPKRVAANIMYFEALQDSCPKWPWSWIPYHRPQLSEY